MTYDPHIQRSQREFMRSVDAEMPVQFAGEEPETKFERRLLWGVCAVIAAVALWAAVVI